MHHIQQVPGYLFTVRNHAVHACIRQYDDHRRSVKTKGQLSAAVQQRNSCTKQTTSSDLWQNVVIWNEQTAARNKPRFGTYDRMMKYQINSHSCRLSYIPLHCNSGACRTTAAWIVTRCGRCCINLINYSILNPKSFMVWRENNLYLRFGIWEIQENEEMWDLHLSTSSNSRQQTCEPRVVNTIYFSWIKQIGKQLKNVQKLFPKTGLRIEKQSKVIEIAAPTFNQR